MKIILTPQQKQQLEEMHDSTRDGRVRDRIKAVLLASEGWSKTMISQVICSSKTGHHIKRHFAVQS